LTSLKSLIPTLAKVVELSPAALYERQRALVRGGVLKAKPGRGPGSGVPGTPHAAITLLISILATSSLSEVVDETKRLISLKSVDGTCPVTGKKTFGAALTAILQMRDFFSKTLWVTVERRGDKVSVNIGFRDTAGNVFTSVFGSTRRELEKDYHHLTASATLYLREVLFDVARMLSEQGRASK
jgi:hypothetical protein